MSADAYPQDLVAATWDKKKGTIAKVKSTGIGEALKALQKLHAGVAWSLFDANGVASLAELETKEKAIEAATAKQLKPLLAQAKAVDVLASRWAADFTKDKLIPKSAAQAAAGVAKAAKDLAAEVGQAGAAAQAECLALKTKLLAAQKKADDDEDEESADDLALGKKLVTVLKALRTRDPEQPPLQFMAVVAKGQARVFIGKKAGPAQKAMLTRLIGGGSVKAAAGVCVWEKNTVTFVCDPPPSGLAKLLAACLLELTGARRKVRVRGTAADAPVEGAGDDEDDGDAPKQQAQPTDTAALEAELAALALRLKEAKAELDRLRAYDTPVGANLRERVAAIEQALQARQPQGVGKLLDQLAQVAKAVAAQRGGAGAAAAGAAAALRDKELTAELAALAARFTPMKDELTRLKAYDTPVGADLSARVAAIEQALQARQPDGLGKLLDQLAQIAKAVAVQRGAGNAAADAAALKEKEREKELAAELAALALRLKGLQDELTRLKAYDTPIGADLRKRVAAIEAALQARTPAGQAKALDELAQIAKAVASRQQGGAAAAVKGAEITQEKAAQQRAKDLGVEVDTALAELRRVTQTIKDAALRKPVAQGLDALFAGKVAAQKLATPAAQIDALQAVLDGGPAVRKLADEALLEEAAKLAYETAFGLLKVAVEAAASALSGSAALFTDALKDAYEGADKLRADAVAAKQWGDAKAALKALEDAAAGIAGAVTAHAAYLKAYAAIQATFEAAEAIVAGSPHADIEGDVDDFNEKREPLDDAVAARDWVAAEAAVQAAGESADDLVTAAAEHQLYLDAYDLVQDDCATAEDLLNDEPDEFTPKIAKDFADADRVIDEHLANLAWADAADDMPALGAAAAAVIQADKEFDEFDDELDPLRPDLARVLGALETAPLPETESKGLEKALKALDAVDTQRDWVAAKACVAPLQAAIQAADAVLLAGDKFYSALAAISATVEAANEIDSDEDRLALPRKTYDDAWERMNKAVKARDWDKAAARVAEVETAGLALVAANEAFDLDSQPFEAEYAKLTDLDAARKVSNQAPATFKPAELDTFRAAYLKVNDARNAGDFGVASAGLDALGKAITALLKVKAEDDKAHADFEKALAAVADLAQARALAASPDPALATAAKALTDADAAVAAAVKLGTWGVALAAVPALDLAVKGLLVARNGANTAVTPEQASDLAQRILALKPRSDLATQPPDSGHLAPLKKAVVARLAATHQAVSAKDYVAAEVALAALRLELDAMDKGLKDHDEHLARFKAAKDGDIKQALAVKLNSPTLQKLRADALAKTEKAIQAMGHRGKLAKADAMIVEWVDEAKAWNKAKAVYLNLKSSGGPDRAKLEALANELGGGKVLDALVAQLPDDTPQKFLNEALAVRYGFSVKQFEKKNAKRVTDLTGLAAVDVNLPDKSLKDMYAMLGKVPLANVKGKIDELIRFTDEDGGAAYGGKKVYMYCGRTDDPKASQQKFGQAGEVVPDGEEVDDACKPVDDKPVPYFNFAAIHEVGHAVDDAKKYMKSATFKAYAGWEKHTSDDVAAKVAAHFDYDLDYVKATLADKKSKAPPAPPTRSDRTDADWDAARKKVDAWCQSVRVSNALWNQAGLSKQHAINGRVYHEAYDGDWVSYLFSARAQGITGYQFRAPGEWFAELYAAYFSKKLKKSHPATAWLKTLKTIT